MFFDLNVPIPFSQTPGQGQSASKKGKGKQPNVNAPVTYSAAQINALETRVDLLVRLGYTVIAFNQMVHKKVEPKAHNNTVQGLVDQLRRRPGIIYLKRLSIILDGDSEKGFGLTNANASLFTGYDLIGLVPTTQATFSLACLTHSMPSPLTAHIISLPLTLPRLPFHLKHTLIRTATKNGAVFEISYIGALGGDNDPVLVDAGGAENGATAKRNWWAAARELTRVTKGKSLIISGGVVSEADLRAPRDVANLITLLGLAQDVAHSSLTKVPKSVVLRAQTRKTYRAVLSEPTLVIPEGSTPPTQPMIPESSMTEDIPATPVLIEPSKSQLQQNVDLPPRQPNPPKRPREDGTGGAGSGLVQNTDAGESRKKKRKKGNKGANS